MRNWLKDLREKQGLTMAELAQKLDISESYYSLIEKGARQQRMDIQVAVKLAAILNVDLATIAEKEKAMTE